jgi:hypothetical protein
MDHSYKNPIGVAVASTTAWEYLAFQYGSLLGVTDRFMDATDAIDVPSSIGSVKHGRQNLGCSDVRTMALVTPRPGGSEATVIVAYR